MSNIKGMVAQTEVSRGGEADFKYVRMLRDGTISFADFLMVMLFEGYIKTANGGGVASTAIAFAGAYDADGQDFGLNVPDSLMVMPIKVEVQIEALTDDTDMEILFMTSNTALTGTTGTAVTPVNKRMDLQTGSGCTCYVAFDAAGGTDVSGGAKAQAFWRCKMESGAAPAAAQSEESTITSFSYVVPRDGMPPMILGGGCIAGHVQGPSNGFVTVDWLETPAKWWE